MHWKSICKETMYWTKSMFFSLESSIHIGINYFHYCLIIHCFAILSLIIPSSLSSVSTSSLSSTITLEGSPYSYAQYRKWFTTMNGTLSFEFKTTEPNSLLLYTDDGGISDFVELKLIDGVIRLRFNLGSGSAILSAGRNLADSQWHYTEISRSNDDTTLKVRLK